MKIPNYDSISESDSDYKRLLPYLPSNTFRMLMCGPSGCGKTNTLMHMLYKPLYFEKIYLFSKNLEQPKYRKLLETIEPISEEAGYLSQSYYLTPKDIRLNCSHFCIFDSPSANETARMCLEVNVPKNEFLRATAKNIVLPTLTK